MNPLSVVQVNRGAALIIGALWLLNVVTYVVLIVSMVVLALPAIVCDAALKVRDWNDKKRRELRNFVDEVNT